MLFQCIHIYIFCFVASLIWRGASKVLPILNQKSYSPLHYWGTGCGGRHHFSRPRSFCPNVLWTAWSNYDARLWFGSDPCSAREAAHTASVDANILFWKILKWDITQVCNDVGWVGHVLMHLAFADLTLDLFQSFDRLLSHNSKILKARDIIMTGFKKLSE